VEPELKLNFISCKKLFQLKGVVHFSKKKKLLLIIYSPSCHQRCPCPSFFSRKEIKVFDENKEFFSIKWNSMGTKQGPKDTFSANSLYCPVL